MYVEDNLAALSVLIQLAAIVDCHNGSRFHPVAGIAEQDAPAVEGRVSLTETLTASDFTYHASPL